MNNTYLTTRTKPETRDHMKMDAGVSYGGCEHIMDLKIWEGEALYNLIIHLPLCFVVCQ